MENIHDIGRVAYIPAEPQKGLTFLEKISFSLALLKDIIVVIVLSVPLMVSAIHKLIVKSANKPVSGQTVLVRIKVLFSH